LKNVSNLLASLKNLEAWKIGTSGPIDADGDGPQKLRQASSMGIGREGAVCEYIEIMQIPPRFERRFVAYKSNAGVLQYPPAAPAPNENLQGTSRICATRQSLLFDLPNRLC
jgi:hypothetical protein